MRKQAVTLRAALKILSKIDLRNKLLQVLLRSRFMMARSRFMMAFAVLKKCGNLNFE